MKAPIVLVDGLDIQFFRSPDELIRRVEAVDVEDDVYSAYDAAGQKLNFVLSGEVRRGRIFVNDNGVSIRLVPTGAFEESQLVSALSASLAAKSNGAAIDVESMNLEELIWATGERLGYGRTM